MPAPDLPIGVFDSGLGGLTVLRELHRRLPAESTIYLGDTARVPYGTKSARVVARYALNNARVLVQRGIKLLVVACNTASAVALDELSARLAIPVMGVIAPGARRAAAASTSGVIGVIGTEGTIASGAYQRALADCRADVQVVARACPLFVPLAEEGWHEHPLAEQVAREYLTDWIPERLDTLILGCTHYPVLAPVISRVLGPGVRLVDSASAVAQEVSERLASLELFTTAQTPPSHHFLATDVPERLARVGSIFLGRAISTVERVDLELCP